MGEFQGAQVTSELSSEKGGRLSISLFSLGTYATAASQGARVPRQSWPGGPSTHVTPSRRAAELEVGPESWWAGAAPRPAASSVR